jgi:endonuclease G
MKKNCFFFLFLFISLSIKCQDLITIKHKNYTTTFSKTLKYPVLVEWWVSKSKIKCKNPHPLKDSFMCDPNSIDIIDLNKDYKNSKFVRAFHMSPNQNRCGDERELIECFYFSNISPQYSSLNNGLWKNLEVLERNLVLKYDSLHIYSGSQGKIGEFGINKINIPKYCWRVIYIKRTKEWLCFVFDNVPKKKMGLHEYQVDLEYINKLTGINFLKNDTK